MSDAFRSNLDAAKVRIKDLEEKLSELPPPKHKPRTKALKRMEAMRASLARLEGISDEEAEGRSPRGRLRTKDMEVPVLLFFGAISFAYQQVAIAFVGAAIVVISILGRAIVLPIKQHRARLQRIELDRLIAAEHERAWAPVRVSYQDTLEDALARIDELTDLVHEREAQLTQQRKSR